MDDFSARLTAARQHAGLTQTQLGKAVGLSQGAIGDLERGRRNSTTKIVEIAAATGVSANWLATGQGAMTAAPGVREDVAEYTVDNKERILVELFKGLTKTQQDEVIRRLSAQKQENDNLLNELIHQRQA